MADVKSLVIKVEIQGLAPGLLMDKYNVTEDSDTTRFKTPNHLSPRELAEQAAYITEKGEVYYPARNIFCAIMGAGIFHKMGRRQITTAKSSLVPAGLRIEEDIVFFGTKQFEVDSQRVVTQRGEAILKTRARMDAGWKLQFTLIVDPKMFNEETVRLLVEDAGSKVGLGCFRPARKGPYGRFQIIRWEKQLIK